MSTSRWLVSTDWLSERLNDPNVAVVDGSFYLPALKRDAGLKDTGRLLLGHGGMLDRLDALLFAAVVSFYLLLAFGAA